MRITQRAVTLTSLQGLNRNLDAVGKLQQQLTSGRLINAPSDSPTGTNRAMQTRTELASVSQEARNISDGGAWLEQSDSTIQNMLDAARKVRDLTVQGLSTGSSSDASQKALATEVGQRLKGEDVVRTLDRILRARGKPKYLFVDNGSEFSGRMLDLWAYRHQVRIDFSRPGKPTDNGHVETFNGSLRDECLNVHWFESLAEARATIEA